MHILVLYQLLVGGKDLFSKPHDLLRAGDLFFCTLRRLSLRANLSSYTVGTALLSSRLKQSVDDPTTRMHLFLMLSILGAENSFPHLSLWCSI
jgi:hypothetical protein